MPAQDLATDRGLRFATATGEKGDRLDRRFLHSSSCVLLQDDLTVTAPTSRLRTTPDWVVMHSNVDAPPCLVIGADGDGQRGVACAFDVQTGIWRLLSGIKLPAATLQPSF